MLFPLWDKYIFEVIHYFCHSALDAESTLNLETQKKHPNLLDYATKTKHTKRN